MHLSGFIFSQICSRKSSGSTVTYSGGPAWVSTTKILMTSQMSLADCDGAKQGKVYCVYASVICSTALWFSNIVSACTLWFNIASSTRMVNLKRRGAVSFSLEWHSRAQYPQRFFGCRCVWFFRWIALECLWPWVPQGTLNCGKRFKTLPPRIVQSLGWWVPSFKRGSTFAFPTVRFCLKNTHFS